MSLLSALVVTALGAVCAVGTVWWALRAERAYGAAPARRAPAPEPAWWESTEWWPALNEDERQWVLRNLAVAGHSTADAALRHGSTPE